VHITLQENLHSMRKGEKVYKTAMCNEPDIIYITKKYMKYMQSHLNASWTYYQ